MEGFKNTIRYYAWWLEYVGFDFLPEEQKQSLLHRILDHRSDSMWNIGAAKKALSYRTWGQRKESNLEARKQGRRGERMVVEDLIRNGWDILVEPSEELYPKFGTSTSGYDILCLREQTVFKVEVKSISESSPFITLRPQTLKKIIKAGTNIIAFVKGDDIYYVFVDQIQFDEPIYVHDAVRYPAGKRMVHLNVVDQNCLRRGI
jgi:Holliday junction resolvase